MSLTSCREAEQENTFWDAPFDLSDLASQSAVELDNLILGVNTDLQATTKLVRHLAESIPEDADNVKTNSGLDPTTVVTLNKAIGDSSWSKQLHTVADLASEANKIRCELESLTSKADNSVESPNTLIIKLRNFCLALSKRASVLRAPSLDFEMRHPFRR